MQFTGWLGPCTGTGNCTFTVNGATTAIATFAPFGLALPRLDIDGTATYDPLTDGLLILRYLFGLTGTSLVNGVVGPTPPATRTTAAQITSYLTDIRPALDIDGNGQADALTDGLLVIRYLFGLRGSGLITGAVGAGATRSTVVNIESQLQDLLLPNVLRGPYLNVATPTSMTVRWRTDVNTTGRVRYGTNPANLSLSADAIAPAKDQVVILTGLSPDTSHRSVSRVPLNVWYASRP